MNESGDPAAISRFEDLIAAGNNDLAIESLKISGKGNQCMPILPEPSGMSVQLPSNTANAILFRQDGATPSERFNFYAETEGRATFDGFDSNGSPSDVPFDIAYVCVESEVNVLDTPIAAVEQSPGPKRTQTRHEYNIGDTLSVAIPVFCAFSLAWVVKKLKSRSSSKSRAQTKISSQDEHSAQIRDYVSPQ